MTAPTPATQTVQQMEFIITEDQVKTIGEITNNKKIMDILRFRPAPSADAVLKELEEFLLEHEKTINNARYPATKVFTEFIYPRQHPNGKQV